MDILKELKALKPDEPDDEISKDVQTIRQSQPGISDDEIFAKAQALVKGGGQAPAAPTPAPMQPPAAPSPAPAAPPIPAPTAPVMPPASAAPPAPGTEDLFPEEKGIHGKDVAMAALQGLSGLGDAITRSYGGGQSDFLKTSLGVEQQAKENKLNRQKLVAEAIKNKRSEGREDKRLELDESKLGLEKAKADASIMKDTLENMRQANKNTFEMEEKLRDGFTQATKTFAVIRDQYGAMQAATKDPSAAGDLATIFAFMKLVDPGSTVREGEFATAASAAGLPQRFIAAAQRVDTGERLSPQQRQDFVDQAQKLYQSHKTTFDSTKSLYQGLATSYGLNPDNATKMIVGEAAAPPAGAPKPGLPTITSDEQYKALPSGAEYIDGAGVHKRKK